MNDYILIEYSNSVDFGNIVYHNAFENRVWLKADVSKPEYELVEEGIENNEGEFSATFQKWLKKYQITFYAQEYLTDALTLMALHDNITITLKNGESSKTIDIEVTPTWDSNIECWAEVSITFVTDYIIRKNCDENMTQGCVDPSYTIASARVLITSSGEFTDPTNNGVSDGDIYFFYEASNAYKYYGNTTNETGVYQLVRGSWELQTLSDGDFVEITGVTDYVYLVRALPAFFKTPYIISVVDGGGGDAVITSVIEQVESNFIQIQYDTGGGFVDLGDPIYASELYNGYTINTGGTGSMDFQLKWYTHSCDYGTSNIVTQTIT